MTTENEAKKVDNTANGKAVSVERIVRCADCDFWSKKNQYWNDDIYGVCTEIIEADETTERNAPAYVYDCMEGSSHKLSTRGDFGCILGRSTQ